MFIIPSLQGGGAERQLQLLSKGLVGEGHRVDVVYLQQPMSEEPFVAGVNYVKLRVNSNYSLRILQQVAATIQNRRPDVVQTWITQVDIVAGLLRKVTDFKWVIRESSNKGARSQTLKLRLRKLLAARADAIIANSSSGLAYWNGRPFNQVLQVIPNGFAFQPARLRSYQDGLKIISVGRLIPSKNHLASINLVEKLNAIRPVTLTIIGDGPQRDRLASAIQERNLAQVVELKSFMDQQTLAENYREANVYLSLSKEEGMPNTVIEAAIHKLPLILSSIDAHTDLFAPTQADFASDGNQAVDLDRLTTRTADEWQALAVRGYNAVTKFTVGAMSRNYLDVYKTILDG